MRSLNTIDSLVEVQAKVKKIHRQSRNVRNYIIFFSLVLLPFAAKAQEPTNHATAFNNGTRTATSIQLTWVGAVGATLPTNYLIVARKATGTFATVADGGTVADDNDFTGASANGAINVGHSVGANTYTWGSLDPATQYEFLIYSYTSGTTNYKIDGVVPGVIVTTLAAEPTQATTALAVSNVTANSMTLTPSGGNGATRLLLARATNNSFTFVPADGTTYTANNNFGAAADQGGGDKIVGLGAGAFNVTGLTGDVNYFFRVIELNGSSGTENYYSSTFQGNQQTEPTTQASALNFTSVTATGMTLDWTVGNGDRRVVLIRSGSAVTADPTDFTNYATVNADWNSGAPTATQIGVGNYIVYDGTGTSVSLTNMVAGTDYHFSVYEYNGSSLATAVYMTPGSVANRSTLAAGGATAVTGVTFSNITQTGITVQNTTGGSGTGRMVVARLASAGAVTFAPVDGVSYNTQFNASFTTATEVGPVGDGNKIIGLGSAPFPITDLTGDTNYNFAVFTFNGTVGTGTENYQTAAAFTASRNTEPTSNATALLVVLGGTGTTQLTASWTNGNGDRRVVLAHEGAPVDADPVDFTNYTASTDWSAKGTQVGTGNYVVFAGTGTSLNMTNLVAGAQYYFTVFEANGAGLTTSAYLTPGASASRLTLALQPTAASSAMTFSNITVDGLTVGKTSGAGTGAFRMLVARPGAAVNFTPTDGVSYNSQFNADYSAATEVGTVGQGNKIVGLGNNASFTVTGLNGDQIYHFAIIEFNGSVGSGAENYFGTTLASSRNTEPTVQASFNATTAVTASGMQLNWTFGNGDRRLILMRAGGAVNANPSDLTLYAEEPDWGLRGGANNEVGTGNFVVYEGSGSTSVAITNLQAGTTYHFAIYEYNSYVGGAIAGTTASGAFLTPAGTASQATTADATLPANFTVGAVAATGGTAVAGYWNLSNTALNVTIPLVSTDISLDQGTVQLQFKNASGTFSNISGALDAVGSGLSTITYAQRNAGTKVISVSRDNLDNDAEWTAMTEGTTFQITAIITDFSGNSRTGTQSATNTTFDETRPALVVGGVTLDPRGTFGERIYLKFTEALAFADNDLVTGISIVDVVGETVTGTVDYQTSYTDGNATITLPAYPFIRIGSSATNGFWTTTTGVTYTTGGNIRDVAGNEPLGFIDIKAGDNTDPFLVTGMVFNPDGANTEKITFRLSESLSLAEGPVLGFKVSQPAANTVATAVYSGKGTTETITLTSPSPGAWTDAVTVSYVLADGNATDGAGRELTAIANEPILLTSIDMFSSNPITSDYANATHTASASFNSARTLSALPTVTIAGAATTVTGPLTGPFTAVTTAPLGSGVTPGSMTFQIDVAEASGKTTTTTFLTVGNSVIFDNTAPVAPSAPDLSVLDDLGVSNTDNITSATTNLDFSGTCETGGITVRLYDGATLISTVNSNGVGGYNFPPISLAPGFHNLTTTATDFAGNISSASAITKVKIDNTPVIDIIHSIERSTPAVNSWSGTNGVNTVAGGQPLTFKVTFKERIVTAGISSGMFSVNLGLPLGSPSVAFLGQLFVFDGTYPDSIAYITLTGVTGLGKVTLNFTESNFVQDLAGNSSGPALGDGNFITPFTNNYYFSLVLPPPTNVVGGFTIPFEDQVEVQLRVNQDPTVGAQLPTHYLLMARESLGSTPFPPVSNSLFLADDDHDNNNYPSGNYAAGDGLFVFNQPFSAIASHFFFLLKTGVNYDFVVYPYTLNASYSNDNIAYGPPSTINNFLVKPVATNSTLTSLPAPSPIPSTFNSVGNQKKVFEFTVTDGLGTEQTPGWEYAPTKFSALTVGEDIGLDNVPNWSTIIAGAELYDVNAPTTFVTASLITANQITFSAIPSSAPGDLGYVNPSNAWPGWPGAAMVSSKTYGVRIYLNSGAAALTDNQVLAFRVNNTSFTYNDGLGTVADHHQSTKLQAGGTAASGANIITVTATKLVFTTNLPATIGVLHPFLIPKPVLQARDANDNIDINFTGHTITPSNGAINYTSSDVFAAGVLTLNSFVFNDPGTTTITVSGPGITTNAVSSSVDVVRSASTTVVQSGVVPGSIPSITTFAPGAVPTAGQLNAVVNFSFTVSDDAGVAPALDDVLPTRINTITIRQNAGLNGSGAAFDNWTQSIAGAQLRVGATTVGGTVTVNNNNIVFGGIANNAPADLGYIADGANRVYTLYIWLQNPVNAALRDIIDQEDFVFEISNASDLALTNAVGNYSSTIDPGFTPFNSGNANNRVEVTSTQFDFITQWVPNAAQSYDAALIPNPTAKARDANQNLDLGFNTATTIAAFDADGIGPKSYPLANSAVTVNNGSITFNAGLQVSSSGNGLNGDVSRLILTSGVITGNTNNFVLGYSGSSDIVRDGTFTHPTDINYINNREAVDLNAANSIALDRFLLREGGTTNDADGSKTKLASITLNVTNHLNIRRIGLYDETGLEIKDLDSVAFSPTGDITFNTLSNPFEANDDDRTTKRLTVRASFRAIYAGNRDNQQINVSVLGATAGGASSQLVSPLIIPGDNLGTTLNKIEVVATKIDFTTVPATASISVPIEVIVSARDVYGNLDTDYNGAIASVSNTIPADFNTINHPSGNFLAGLKAYPWTPTTGSAATDFQFDKGNGLVQLTIGAGAGSGGGINAGAVTGTSPAINIISSFESRVTVPATSNLDGITPYNLAPIIPYVNHQSANLAVTDDSFELVQLVVSDGDADGIAGDLDGAPTRLQTFKLGLTNYTAVRSIAAYNDAGVRIVNGVIAGVAGIQGEATFDFTGSEIIAPDNQQKLFKIRATFQSSGTLVSDTMHIRLSLRGGTLAVGSLFYNPTGTYVVGIAPTNLTAPANLNKIDVVATSLDFVDGNSGVAPNHAASQPSTYAGINEPVGPSYTAPPLPSTLAGIVTARDKFGNVDLGFVPASITLRDANNNILIPPSGGLSFTAGVMNLDGMRYPAAVGNKGAVQVITTTPSINSAFPSGSIGNSVPCNVVNVLDVSVSIDIANGVLAGSGSPPSQPLKGGQQGLNIFGLRFTANSTDGGTEPKLKGFTINFKDGATSGPVRNWYEDTQNSLVIFSGFKVFIDGTANDITSFIAGSTVSKVSSQGNQYLNQIVVTLGTPQVIGSGISFYLFADVDPSTNTSTQTLVPYFIDAGYGTTSDDYSILTYGTSMGVPNPPTSTIPGEFDGAEFSFASTQPPTLRADIKKYPNTKTYPFAGQSNVDPAISQITLEFDTNVGVLDNLTATQVEDQYTGELWNRGYNTKVADLKLNTVVPVSPYTNPITPASQGVVSGTSLVNIYPKLVFDIVNKNSSFFGNDSVFYVKIRQGTYDPISNVGRGISDFGLNFYGGISNNSTLYFKISSSAPIQLTSAVSNFNTRSLGTLTTTFDQLGTAYYLIVRSNDLNSPAPTIPEITGQSNYLTNHPTATLAASGSYQITSVNVNQTHTFAANFAVATNYDVYIFAKNNALPTPIPAASIYSFPGLISGIQNQQNSHTPNSKTYTLCPDSYVTITDPMIVGETSDASFFARGFEQDFNVLLPTGFQFDVTVPPTIQLIGTPDFSPTWGYRYLSNTLLNIKFTNGGASSTDYIAISGLTIIGKSGSPQGEIRWFYGNNIFTPTLTPFFPLARLSLKTNPIPDFTNSYWYNNQQVAPFQVVNSSAGVFNTAANKAFTTTVNAIPDNYIDPSNIGSIRLLPMTEPYSSPANNTFAAGDFLASFYSGSGVSGDLLTLNAVTAGAAFNIFMTHTDLNGCETSKKQQYVVYDHNSPISKKLGVTLNTSIDQSTQQLSPPGTKQDLVNSNFNTTTVGNRGSANPIASPTILFNELAGYSLLQLNADLPASEIALNNSSSSSQIISGSLWRTLVTTTLLNPVLPLVNYNNYTWDYSTILNAPTSVTGLANVYDYFKSDGINIPLSPNRNNYWIGGSLGKIQFTGAYQSTADNSVYVPFRQDVELFVPAVPLIEIVSPTPFYDQADVATTPNFNINQYPSSNTTNGYPGTATFCEAGGTISLTAYPTPAGGKSVGSFAIYDYASYNFASGAVNTPIQSPTLNPAFVDNKNGTMTLSPSLINGGNSIGITNNYRNILVTYTYQENISPAIGVGYLIIRITPNPVASFVQASDLTFGNIFIEGKASAANAFCQAVPILFTTTSGYDPANAAANAANVAITEWAWNFGDVNSGAANTDIIPSPTHAFGSIGQYTVTHSVKTQWGCANTNINTTDIVIGSFPSSSTVPFEISGVSNVAPISFISQLGAVDGTNSISDVTSTIWSYGDASPSDALGSHGFTPGPFRVTLTGTTTINGTLPGCTKSFSRNILVLDKRTATANSTYTESFESSDGNWKVRDDFKNPDHLTGPPPSWVRGMPSGTRSVIRSSPDGGTNIWATGLSGNFVRGERSFLYPPVIDFSTLVRPMVSFHSIRDLGFDGVVLEYSTDNRNVADSLKVWQTVGDNTTGVDWFNAQIIASKPGNQLSGDYGWSGSVSSWVESKHSLATVAVRNNVAFRFAFASNQDGGEGFGVDNFRVGERNRLVLIENFTNAGNTSVKEKEVSDYLANFPAPNSIGSDVVQLSYHVGFPEQDPFNLDNPADPSGRALYYGVAETPSTRLDGKDESNSIQKYFTAYGQKAYDNQTLELANAQISIAADTVKKEGAFRVISRVTAIDTLRADAIVHVVLAEQRVLRSDLSSSKALMIKTGQTTFEYVVKKMLPSASGTRIGQTLIPGQSFSDTLKWVPDPAWLYGNNNDMKVIVFVQDEKTRTVFQSQVFNLTTTLYDPSPVTALENPFSFEDVLIYPNPADQQLNIVFPNQLEVDVPLMMFDQVGKVTHTTKVVKGEKSATLETGQLAAGLYILKMDLGNGKVSRAKVIVGHRE
jgi:Bacterial Ig-like domain/Secretion system C-terminal sorting domain/PKD domain